MIDRGFIAQNDAARRELKDVVNRLGERDFDLAAGRGWTISTQLCHIAFWDRRILFLLREWQSGRFETSRLSPQSIHSINDAVNAIAMAVPGPASAALAVEAAEAADVEVAGLADDLIEQIVAAGFERFLKRSLHRMEHLRTIREALAAQPPASSV